MIALAIIFGLPLAGFALGIGLGAGSALAPLVEDLLVRWNVVGFEPDSVFEADQTNVVHADFRPGRWHVPFGGDAG